MSGSDIKHWLCLIVEPENLQNRHRYVQDGHLHDHRAPDDHQRFYAVKGDLTDCGYKCITLNESVIWRMH